MPRTGLRQLSQEQGLLQRCECRCQPGCLHVQQGLPDGHLEHDRTDEIAVEPRKRPHAPVPVDNDEAVRARGFHDGDRLELAVFLQRHFQSVLPHGISHAEPLVGQFELPDFQLSRRCAVHRDGSLSRSPRAKAARVPA